MKTGVVPRLTGRACRWKAAPMKALKTASGVSHASSRLHWNFSGGRAVGGLHRYSSGRRGHERESGCGSHPAETARRRQRRAGRRITALHWAAYQRRSRNGEDCCSPRARTSRPQRAKAQSRRSSWPAPMAMPPWSRPAKGRRRRQFGEIERHHGTDAAAASGSADAVKLLLDRGADVNAKESAHGQTAVMFAAALDRDAVIRLLAEHHADLNVATPGRKLEHVRFDQDGNVVKRPAGGRTRAARRARPMHRSSWIRSRTQIGLESAVYLVDAAAARSGRARTFSRAPMGLKDSRCIFAMRRAPNAAQERAMWPRGLPAKWGRIMGRDDSAALRGSRRPHGARSSALVEARRGYQ